MVFVRSYRIARSVLGRTGHAASGVIILVVDCGAKKNIFCGVEIAFVIVGVQISAAAIVFYFNRAIESIVGIGNGQAVSELRLEQQAAVVAVGVGGERGAACGGGLRSAKDVVGQTVGDGAVNADARQSVAGVAVKNAGVPRGD